MIKTQRRKGAEQIAETRKQKPDNADIVIGAWKDVTDKEKDVLLRKLAKRVGLWTDKE